MGYVNLISVISLISADTHCRCDDLHVVLYRPNWPTVLSVVPLVQCVVCLSSVTFCIVAKRYVLAKKCLTE